MEQDCKQAELDIENRQVDQLVERYSNYRSASWQGEQASLN